MLKYVFYIGKSFPSLSNWPDPRLHIDFEELLDTPLSVFCPGVSPGKFRTFKNLKWKPREFQKGPFFCQKLNYQNRNRKNSKRKRPPIDDNNLGEKNVFASFFGLGTSNNRNDTSNDNEIVEDDDLMEILNSIFHDGIDLFQRYLPWMCTLVPPTLYEPFLGQVKVWGYSIYF